MKFYIDKKDLSTLTSIVSRAAAHKNTIPVLSGLLLQVSNEKGLVMTATDMEIGIKASLPDIEIIEEGQVLVNANYFADFIKLLPDSKILVELNKQTAKLNITYGRSSGYINTYREFEYPDLPTNNLQHKFSIPQNILREGLRKTVFATAINHFRQVFTGVLFDIKESNLLKIVASDTHRLAYYTYNIPNTQIEPLNFIIPARSINEIMRFINDSDEVINIALNENYVIFYKKDVMLLSRLIEGQYPNYDQVIPDKFNTSVKFESHLLENTLERARIMPSDDKIKIQRVNFTFKNNEAIVNTNSEVMGEITEVLEGLNIEGDNDLHISFNTNYFLDVVKILSSETTEINVDLSTPLSPAKITNPHKDNYMYILVPLRTN